MVRDIQEMYAESIVQIEGQIWIRETTDYNRTITGMPLRLQLHNPFSLLMVAVVSTGDGKCHRCQESRETCCQIQRMSLDVN